MQDQQKTLARTCDDTKIRNFKFKTEQDDLPGWAVVDGTDCYPPCSGVAGHCDYCGKNGYCCSGKRHDINGDCTDEMITAIHQVFQISKFSKSVNIKNVLFYQSEWSDTGYHMCVAKRAEDSCTDWTYERDWDCWYNDIGGAVTGKDGSFKIFE